MNKLKSLPFFLLSVIAIMLVCFVSGIFFNMYQSDPSKQKITSVMIVDRINDEAFLLTKTAYIDQDIEIIVDEGSDWSNFWWGQTLTAEALVRINIGVDLSKLEAENVTVDQYQKKIVIKLPQAEVQSGQIEGDISVHNQQGLLKLLFDNDTNADYNLAYSQLITQATEAITQRNELFTSAREDTSKLLELILKDTGYTVLIEE